MPKNIKFLRITAMDPDNKRSANFTHFPDLDLVIVEIAGNSVRIHSRDWHRINDNIFEPSPIRN